MFEEAILNVGQNGCFKKCVASLHYHHGTWQFRYVWKITRAQECERVFLGNLINSMHVSQNMTVILFVSESKNHVEFVKSAHQ
jgi:hypothetical protein